MTGFRNHSANLNAYMCIHSALAKNHSPDLPFKVSRAEKKKLHWAIAGQAIVCTQGCTVPMDFEGKKLCNLLCV